MSISETQLDTWSHVGSESAAKATHEAIRNALARYSWPSGMRYDDYLQGSYRNTTNIRGDSDVDLVLEFTSSFQSNATLLPPDQRQAQDTAYGPATYSWSDYRSHTVDALKAAFGGDVSEGKKCVKVARRSGRLTADVVVCLTYRYYGYFFSSMYQQFTDGITFLIPSEYRWVVNYPKQHYDNGVAKNGYMRTSGNYKPLVRIIKNARRYLVERGDITRSVAPSYFVECMMYNAPDSAFNEATYGQATYNVLAFLENANVESFICQNGQIPLIGPSPEQWSVASASTLIQALIRLWNSNSI